MNKFLFLSLLLSFPFFAQAQTRKDSLSASLQGDNEIKLNILYTIAGLPELTYERILDAKNAVGVSAFLRATTVIKSDFSYAIVPYYRHYFGARKASGFFLEGNTLVTRYDDVSSRNSQQSIDKTVFGIGAATGAKFLTRKGFTGEIYLGASKTLDNTVIDFFPRAGLVLGKRF